MVSMKYRMAFPIATLALNVAITPLAAAAGDEWLVREMAKTDGDPNGLHATLQLDARNDPHSRADDGRDLLREMARTDGDPLGLHANLARAPREGAATPERQAADGDLIRELARTDGDPLGTSARLSDGKLAPTSFAGNLKRGS